MNPSLDDSFDPALRKSTRPTQTTSPSEDTTPTHQQRPQQQQQQQQQRHSISATNLVFNSDAQPSSTAARIPTASTAITSSNNNNNNNNTITSNSNNNISSNSRKHSHTAGHTKTRPMMRSASGQLSHLHHHHHHHHHHHSTTSAASYHAAQGNTGAVHKPRRRRAKFVFGEEEQEQEEPLRTEQRQQGQDQRKEGEGRLSHHEGHRPRYQEAVQHLNDPRPQQVSQHTHRQLQQNSAGLDSPQKQFSQENQDAAYVPTSQSIPNSSKSSHSPRRTKQEQIQVVDHLQIEHVQTPPSPSQKEEPTLNKEQEPLRSVQQSMHDFVVGSSQPPAGAVSESSFEPAPISTPDDTIANEITSSKPIAVVPDPAEGAAPITLNPPTLIVHASMPSGSGPVSSIVGKDQESINTDRDTGSSSNHTRTIVDPHQHHPPHFEHLQPSERLSRLLNPTPSTASLPSITRTISHPVLATTSPKLLSHGDDSGEHLDSAAKSSNDLSLRHGASQHHQQQRHLISPVSEMMSKFLSPYKQTRSQSQTNLAAGGASQRPHKRTGSDVSATSAVRAEQQQRHHPQQQQQRFQYKRQPPQRANNASTGGRLVSMMSPPRSSGGEAAAYLISRFLPTSPTQQFSQYGSPMPKNGSMFTSSVGTSIVPSAGPEVTSTSGSGAGSGVGTGLGSASASRRRLPASLRMTSAASSTPMNDSSSQLEPTTPSSINSSFSDMPSPSHDDGSNAVFSDSINSDQNNSSGSAWNHVEAMSRTQQKLLLQRASSQVDLDEDEMARRGKMMKDMERLQREYRCVRLFADPVIESLVRSQILKRHVEPGQGERRFVGQTAGEDEREMQRSYSSLSIKSM